MSNQPVFLLRGLDPDSVTRDYNAGYYATYSPSLGQLERTGDIDYSSQACGRSDASPIYLIQDRSGGSMTVATSNHVAYDYYMKNGQPIPGGRCDRCKQDYSGYGVPIPVKYEQKHIQRQVVDPVTGLVTTITQTINIFWGVGEHCGFGCALGEAESDENLPISYQPVGTINSVRWLRFIHKQVYPSQELIANPPGLLFKALGPDKYYKNRQGWIRTNSIIMLPAKVEYVSFNY